MAGEYRVRASLAWQAFARAIGTLRFRLDAKSGAELTNMVAELMGRHSADLEEHFDWILELRYATHAPHPSLESFRYRGDGPRGIRD